MGETMRQRTRKLIFGKASATIDTIDPGSIVVAPRKPIDVSDEQAVSSVLNLAARIGAALLAAGTGAIDTRDQAIHIARLYGLEDIEVDVTYTTILVTAKRGYRLPPLTAMLAVRYQSLDFTRLAEIDRLVRRIRVVAITPGTAHRLLDRVLDAPHPYRYWVATLSWGIMAFGVAFTLGGDLLVAVIAMLTTCTIVSVNRMLNRHGMLPFFQQIVGGFIAVVPAALVFRWSEVVNIVFQPSQIIAAGIVALLAGLSLVGAVQDVITGAPVTGTARFTQVIVMTAGVLAGISLAIWLTRSIGIHLPGMAAPPEFAPVDLPFRVFGGALAGTGFAAGSYAERRAIPAAFVSGAVAVGVAASLHLLTDSTLLQSGAAAIVAGCAGGLLARRSLTPPLIVALAGITPLLPGLMIYRGLFAVMEGDTLAGFTLLVNATTVGCTLAAGVTFGEYIARRVHRPRLPKPHDIKESLLRHLPADRAHPAPESPISGTPVADAPSSGIPSTGLPASGIPSTGRPSAGIPSFGLPSSGIPSAGIPSAGIPPAGDLPTGADAPTQLFPIQDRPTGGPETPHAT